MSMLKRLPKHVPPLDVLLYDIFSPKPAELAKAFEVSEATVRKWIKQNDAPMAVKLALFWLTRWGMQWCDADLYNEAQLHFMMNRCQARQIRDLKGRLRKAARIGNFGAANDPAEGIELPTPDEVRPIQMHKRQASPGMSRRALGDAEAPGMIRRRVCTPPTGFQHHVQKKRRAA